MTLHDLLRDGYRLYRPDPGPHVDCAKLRALEVHLGYLAAVVDTVAHSPAGFTRTSGEWQRVSQWLRMAAGLEHIVIDMFIGQPKSYLCGAAADFEFQHSTEAEHLVREQTRLQLTSNALDRLLHLVDPPAPKGVNGRHNAATALLARHWGGKSPLEHYDCVLAHLRRHLATDAELVGQRNLREKVAEAPWRAHNGLLLAACNQLRHLGAHGDITLEYPNDWRDGLNRTAFLESLHVPRIGSRGVALSIQMLLLTLPISTSTASDLCAPTSSGWPVRTEAGRWALEESAELTTVIAQAHLEPDPDEIGDDH